MRLVVACSLLLASTRASAEPCTVTIPRAPDEVRTAIETWVAAEPDCATTAEVRVVATDGGYYVVAIDGEGRVRERVAPDAQSVAVLVVSWIADDSVPSAPPPTADPGTPPAPPASTITAPPPSPPRRARGWFAAGPVGRLGPRGGIGIGADGQVNWIGGWGLSLSYTYVSNELLPRYPEDGVRDTYDVIVSGNYTSTRGRSSLRLAAGVGIADTRETEAENAMVRSFRPIGEVSLYVTSRMTRRLVLITGPSLGVDLGRPTSTPPVLGFFAGIAVTR